MNELQGGDCSFTIRRCHCGVPPTSRQPRPSIKVPLVNSAVASRQKEDIPSCMLVLWSFGTTQDPAVAFQTVLGELHERYELSDSRVSADLRSGGVVVESQKEQPCGDGWGAGRNRAFARN